MNKKKQLIVYIPLTFFGLFTFFYLGMRHGELRENARWFVGPYSDHLFDKDNELKEIADRLEEIGTEKEIVSKLREVANEIEVSNKIMKERK